MIFFATSSRREDRPAERGHHRERLLLDHGERVGPLRGFVLREGQVDHHELDRAAPSIEAVREHRFPVAIRLIEVRRLLGRTIDGAGSWLSGSFRIES